MKPVLPLIVLASLVAAASPSLAQRPLAIEPSEATAGLQALPPQQVVDIVVGPSSAPSLIVPSLYGKTAQEIREIKQRLQTVGAALLQPTVAWITSHGGTIVKQDPVDGQLGASLAAGSVLELAQNPDLLVVDLSYFGTTDGPMPGQVSVPLPGDVNGDGVVDVRDVLLVIRWISGDIQLTNEQLSAANLYCRFRPGLGDAARILEEAVGLGPWRLVSCKDQVGTESFR